MDIRFDCWVWCMGGNRVTFLKPMFDRINYMDRESSLSESNISTLCLGYTKFRFGIIQIGTISIEAPNRNSQLDIYIKSLSYGYQSQLINKISIQDLMYQKLYIRNNISLFFFFFFPMKNSRIFFFSSNSIHLYI